MSTVLSLLIGLLQVAPANAPRVQMSTMVAYESAAFEMGTAPDLDVGRYGDGWYVNEIGLRRVEVSPFSMDRFEVSTAEFALFLTHACGQACFDERMPISRDGSDYVAMDGYVDQPAVWVDHRSAGWYCSWAGKRLPTEAQWELASGGTSKRPWPWGAEYGPRCTIAPYSYDGGRCTNGPRARGVQAESMTPEGVSDLGGNVSEWVQDWYAAYTGTSESDPRGPAQGTQRVVRGGSFLSSRLQLRPQSRRGYRPDIRSVDLGFRCAWSPDVQDPPGVVRGDLATAEIQAETKIVGVPIAQYQERLSGLDSPEAVHQTGDWVYVAEKTQVTALYADGEVLQLENLDIHRWVSDGINTHGLDTLNGRLIVFRGAEHEVILEEPNLRMVAHHPDGWIWTDGTIINLRQGDGSDRRLVDELVGVTDLNIQGDRLVWSTNSNTGASLSWMDLDGPLEPHILVSPEQVSSPLKISYANQVDASTIILFIGFDSWPYSGLVCQYALSTSRLSCSTHSPPKPRELAFVDERFIWLTQYGMTSFEDGKVSLLGDSLSPGGMYVGEDYILVTDRVGGRLLALPR
jgi:formylglycine-generating enzyme required for sulfatase activity